MTRKFGIENDGDGVRSLVRLTPAEETVKRLDGYTQEEHAAKIRAARERKAARQMTIAANGDIIPKPYGVSRWARPRTRSCTHPGCDKAAKVLDTGHATGKTGAHNCCKGHPED